MKKKSASVSLAKVWRLRLRLRAEGDKLWAEGAKPWAEGEKPWAEGDKLRAEGDKLWAEGVIEAHGNVIINWTSDGCVVEGVEYKNA